MEPKRWWGAAVRHGDLHIDDITRGRISWPVQRVVHMATVDSFNVMLDAVLIAGAVFGGVVFAGLSFAAMMRVQCGERRQSKADAHEPAQQERETGHALESTGVGHATPPRGHSA